MAAALRIRVSNNVEGEETYRIEKDGSLWTNSSDKNTIINEIGLIAVEGLIGGYDVELEDSTVLSEFSEREGFTVNTCKIDYEEDESEVELDSPGKWYCEQRYYDSGDAKAQVFNEDEAIERYTKEKFEEINAKAQISESTFWETSICDVWVERFDTNTEAIQRANEQINA